MAEELSTQTSKLGTASISRLIFTLGFPGMLSMFIMALYNLADTFWVAKLGSTALAALTVVFPYQMLIVALGAGTGIGFSSLLSRHFGAGKTNDTNHIAGQVFPLSFVFGLFFTISTQWFSYPILAFFGATADFIHLASDYLTIVGLGAFFTFFTMITNNCFRGSGNVLLPLLFMSIAAITNIILDPIFIFGWGPIPALGVKGAAWATFISQTLGALIAAWFLLSRHSVYRFTWSTLMPSPRHLRSIFGVGFPTIIMQILASLVIMMSNRILSGYGTPAVATNGLIFRILMMIVMPIAGLSHGLLPIVGFNYGANNFKRLWQAIRLSSISSACIIGLGYITILLFPGFWIGLFSRDQRFTPLANQAIILVMLVMPLLGPFFMWVTSFQGLGKGTIALILTSLRPIVLLILMSLLPNWLHAKGVWVAFPLADTCAFIIAAFFIRREYALQKKAHCKTHQEPVCEDIEATPLG